MGKPRPRLKLPYQKGRFSRVPGWLIESGLFASITPKEKALVVILYFHAKYPHGKAWCKIATLCKEAGLSRKHLGLAKKLLAQRGVLCFCYGRTAGSAHDIWMARSRIYDFAVDTRSPRFKLYNEWVPAASRRSHSSGLLSTARKQKDSAVTYKKSRGSRTFGLRLLGDILSSTPRRWKGLF